MIKSCAFTYIRNNNTADHAHVINKYVNIVISHT